MRVVVSIFGIVKRSAVVLVLGGTLRCTVSTLSTLVNKIPSRSVSILVTQ